MGQADAMENEMASETTEASSQPRRVEPIFDASGTLRHVPAARPHPADTKKRGAVERD